MQHFTIAEQQMIFERACIRAKRENSNPVDKLVSFSKWFNEIQQIDPCSLKQDEIQPLIDKLVNTDDFQFNYALIDNGFFHCWCETAQVPFLQLMHEGYSGSVNTVWKIVADVNKNRYVVREKIHDYFTTNELFYLRNKVNQHTALKKYDKMDIFRTQFDFNSEVEFMSSVCQESDEIIDHITKWLGLIEDIDIFSLKYEHIQKLIDHFFNSTEGQRNINLLSTAPYRCLKNNRFKFFQLARGVKFGVDWEINFDFATEKYVLSKIK